MPQTSVLVMAKAPRAGYSKTRLSPPCSPEQAAEVADAALRDTLDAAIGTGCRVVLALDGAPAGWDDLPVTIVPQRGGTFAERLTDAWTHLPHGGVQIGMDTPQVGADTLLLALAELARADAALGFAPDGGWWALALRAPHPDAFTGIPMSTQHTGARQWERLVGLGLAPNLLPSCRDLDTWADALAIAEQAPALRTSRVVQAIAATLEAVR